MIKISQILLLCFFSFCLFGCAGFGQKLKSFLAGGSSSKATQAQSEEKPKTSNRVKYSDRDNFVDVPRRQYRRVTKKSLREEAQLDDGAGSLWVMEGQGAYLFSENVVRMIGDPIPVKIDGEPKEQLTAKVDVIRKLLTKLENRIKARQRALASQQQKKMQPEGGQGEEDSGGQAKAEKTPAETAKPAVAESNQLVGEEFSVKTVPTRITERLSDGNYRVQGSQPFMIDSKEYKVIVTGIVRAEDFNEDGIASTELLDPGFDIVSLRRRTE